MDEIYEFENNRYRTASIQMKAIAYDIVIEAKNKEPQEKRKAILDELINLTEKIEKQLELLDSLEEPKEKKEEISVSSQEERISESTEEKRIEKPKKDSMQKIEVSPEEKQPMKKEVAPFEEKKEETTLSIPNSPMPSKKQFQKTTKNLSKAIMVKQTQLENLRNSRIRQEQQLAAQGIFEQIENGISKVTEESTVVKKPLPDDVERQIEDLTVKANIYYNEGEIDKAQELYDKINALKQTN